MISSILHKIRSNNRMGNKYGNKKGDGPSYALSLYTKWRTTARFFLHDISYAAPLENGKLLDRKDQMSRYGTTLSSIDGNTFWQYLK